MTSASLAALLALAIMAPAKAQQKQKPIDNIARLASDLYQYGVEREASDRATFPKNMPRVGQPYDWTTGNALPPRVSRSE